MARYAVAGRSTIAGTSLRPNVSLYATAAVTPRVMEVGIFNTTATAAAYSLCRLTAAGTQGVGLTEIAVSDSLQTAIATGFAGHTADLTGAQSSNNPVRQASLGAAIGAGVIWTFVEPGLVIPAGTANGIGILVPTGTGQIIDYYIEWVE